MVQFYFYSISQRPHLLQVTFLKKNTQQTQEEEEEKRENIPRDHYAKFIKTSLNVARRCLNASWMTFTDDVS